MLDDADLARALINSNAQGNLILDPQVEFTPGQVKKLKEFFNDYFDKVAHATEAKALANETKEAFANQKRELEKLHMQAERYPFLRSLSTIIHDLAALEGHPYQWFATELMRDEDKWLDDYKDSVIDPVQKFMKGPSKALLDEASFLLKDHAANLSYVQAEELDAIKSALVDPNIYKRNATKALAGNIQSLKSKLENAIENEKLTATQKVEGLQQKLSQYDGYIALSDPHKLTVQRYFDAAKQHINDQTLIAVIRHAPSQFENDQYSVLLQQIEEWNTPVPVISEPPAAFDNDQSESDTSGQPVEPPKPVTPPKPKVEIVGARDLPVSFNKPLLESEADIDAYLESYKQALVNTVNQGKKVRV